MQSFFRGVKKISENLETSGIDFTLRINTIEYTVINIYQLKM